MYWKAWSGNGNCRAGKARQPEVFGPGSVSDGPRLDAAGAVVDERRAEAADHVSKFCKKFSKKFGHRKSYGFTTNHPRISKERHHDLDA